MRRLFVGSLILVAFLNGMAAADDQAEAKEILKRVIKANGGKAVLSKIVATRFVAKGDSFDGEKKTPIKLDMYYQGNDKMRNVCFDEDSKTDSIDVVDRTEGWSKEGTKNTETLNSEQVTLLREGVYVTWITTFVPLERPEFRLSTLAEISISGRDAVGIMVQHDKHDPVKLYFDKKNYMLLKYDRRFKGVEAGTEIKEETFYSDYRPFEKTMLPYKVVTYWDGVKVSDFVVVEAKLYDKLLDEKLFAKP